ncbi:MAG: hypothetical protein OEY22_07320 [Candidatus Bathyarchaeota archaeon]|nr:hypothetical protein [Candidatus Bathyarchaeota archaeon]
MEKQSAKESVSVYAIISFVIGIVLGMSAVITGITYYYAPWPAHGPIGVVGIFLIVFGALDIFGSILVLKRKTVILGASMVLAFGILSGPSSVGILVPYGFEIALGWALPIVSFACALYSRKST